MKGVITVHEIYWKQAREEIATGRDASKPIAACVRHGWPLPQDLRDYAAGRLLGEIQPPTRPRGRQAAPEDAALRRANGLALDVRWAQAENVIAGRKPARELAITEIAEREHITPDTLRKLIKPRRRGWEQGWELPSLACLIEAIRGSKKTE